MKIDNLDRRNLQIQQILEAVSIRLTSLGCAVILQPQLVSGRYATSLIIGESRDAAAHLHAAESIGVQAVDSVGELPGLQILFAQCLFNSTVRLSELTLPTNPSVQ